MIWLAWHMWLLLALVFLLGLFMGWWLFGGREDHHRQHDDDDMPGKSPLPEPPAAATAKSPARHRMDKPPRRDGFFGSAAMESTAPARKPAEPVKPVLFETPEKGPADRLQRISGIGPRYEKLLNDLGVWYYAQIADWTAGEIAWLDDHLGFPGRITRDRWQEQAHLLLLSDSVGPRRDPPV